MTPFYSTIGTSLPNVRTRGPEKSGLRGFSDRTLWSGGAMKDFVRGKIFVSIAARGFPVAEFKMVA